MIRASLRLLLGFSDEVRHETTTLSLPYWMRCSTIKLMDYFLLHSWLRSPLPSVSADVCYLLVLSSHVVHYEWSIHIEAPSSNGYRQTLFRFSLNRSTVCHLSKGECISWSRLSFWSWPTRPLSWRIRIKDTTSVCDYFHQTWSWAQNPGSWFAFRLLYYNENVPWSVYLWEGSIYSSFFHQRPDLMVRLFSVPSDRALLSSFSRIKFLATFGTVTVVDDEVASLVWWVRCRWGILFSTLLTRWCFCPSRKHLTFRAGTRSSIASRVRFFSCDGILPRGYLKMYFVYRGFHIWLEMRRGGRCLGSSGASMKIV